MSVTPKQFAILESLKNGPRWMKSFQPVKALVDDLVERELAERCRPRLGRAKNMIRLTAAGCELLGIDHSSVPVTLPEAAPLHAIKRWSIGTVRDDVSPLIRHTCETVIGRVGKGATIPDVVGQLADAEGVQRPAIWRRLRAGGIIKPIRTGVRTIRRTNRQISEDTRREAIHVDRDPCPRCGVRADVGCKHSRAPIGMVL